MGLEYDLAANSMLWASFATSYRVNPMTADQGPRTLPPEELKAYTVGSKNRFLENKLQLNASAYYYDYSGKEARVTQDGSVRSLPTGTLVYEDEIVGPDGIPYDINGDGVIDHTAITGGGPGQEDPWVKQHGTFETIGVDVSLDWLATNKDNINLSISYLNAKWKDLEMVFFWHKLVDGVVEPFWPNDGRNYKGWTHIYSPAWTINGGYQHDFELGTFGFLVPRIEIMYKSDYTLSYDPSNYPISYQEPYYMVNGFATFSHVSGKWSINAYVKNATNYAAKKYYSGRTSMGINDPRTYGAVLSIKF